MSDGKLLLDAKDVARLLSVSVRTVWTLRDMGRLPAPVRIGRCVRWRRQDIEKWVERGCPDLAEPDRLARLQRALDRSGSKR